MKLQNVSVQKVPKFSLRSWATRSDVPTVDITFANGVKDTLVLNRYFASEEDKRFGKNSLYQLNVGFTFAR